jgi:hypothetical protein
LQTANDLRSGKGDRQLFGRRKSSQSLAGFPPFDGVYPELSRTGSGRASGEEKVRHTVGKRYPGNYREIAFGTEFNVAKVNGAKL